MSETPSLPCVPNCATPCLANMRLMRPSVPLGWMPIITHMSPLVHSFGSSVGIQMTVYLTPVLQNSPQQQPPPNFHHLLYMSPSPQAGLLCHICIHAAQQLKHDHCIHGH